MNVLIIFIIFLIHFYVVVFSDQHTVIIRGCQQFKRFNDTFCSSDLHLPIAKNIYKQNKISLGKGTTCFCKNNLCNEHQWHTLIEATSSKATVSASVTPFSRSTKSSAVVVRDDTENITSTITMSTINDDKSNPIDSEKPKLNPIDPGKPKAEHNQSSAANIAKNGCGGYNSIHILNKVIIIMYFLSQFM